MKTIHYTIRIIWCVFVYLNTQSIVAQNTTDSLHKKLKHSYSENEKLGIYQKMAEYFKDKSTDSTLFYANLIINSSSSENSVAKQAKAYGVIGETYQIHSKLRESVENYLKAIEIAEKHNEKTALGTLYNGLGITYYYLSDFDKSEYYIKKACDIKLELKDYTYYTITTVNLAGIYFYKKKYSEAINLLQNAEKILLKENQETYLASVYNSLGGIYQIYRTDLDSALFFYNKGIEIAEKHNLSNNLITGYHNLGELNYLKKNYPKAIEYLKRSEKYSLEYEDSPLTLVVYETLSEVYSEVGDFKNAYRYKKFQSSLKDTLFKAEKRKAIEELEFKYQTAKQEKEIQKQKEEIQTAKLISEQQKNRTNIILFISTVLLLIAAFIIVYVLQRKKANQILEKEKSKLFENIVHEIRTPLTLINGPLQLVKKEMTHENGLREHIQMIEQNSDKLVRLVNELLDISKLDKGKYHLSYQNGNLNEFIKSLIDNFKNEANQKNIQISWNPLKESYVLRYPTNALEQIVFNLIGNALKYCPSYTHIAISLSIDNDFTHLKISDNGPGIPQQEQEKIFDRFYRLKRNESIKGTGIGLSMVKELTELMKGKIMLESSEGKGTTFTISFPLEKVNRQIKEIDNIDEDKPHILLVDDEEGILQFVSSLLKTNFNVVTAKNGEEALVKVNEIIPEIVLTDIMMPIKNGLELLQEIKSNDLTNHIPVVIFSAKSSLESRLEGLKHGADAYLPKPFNPDELELIVKNILNTIRRNQQDFQKTFKAEKTFEERIFTKSEYVNKAIQLVINNLANEAYSVNELADDLCISRSQLHRKLTSLTGYSATNFIKMIRLEKAKDLLRTNWGNVTEVAYACGFNSQSYFTKSFTDYFGESPSKFFKK
ncbi:MAG: ATP-binding protein [Flavobacteriales bacterium]